MSVSTRKEHGHQRIIKSRAWNAALAHGFRFFLSQKPTFWRVITPCADCGRSKTSEDSSREPASQNSDVFINHLWLKMVKAVPVARFLKRFCTSCRPVYLLPLLVHLLIFFRPTCIVLNTTLVYPVLVWELFCICTWVALIFGLTTNSTNVNLSLVEGHGAVLQMT